MIGTADTVTMATALASTPPPELAMVAPLTYDPMKVVCVSTVLFTAPRATTRVSAMLNAKNATLCHSYNPQHTQEVIIRT